MHGPDNQNKMDDFLMRSTNHNFLQWKAPLILSCFIVTLPILLSRLEFKVRKADFLLAAPERFFLSSQVVSQLTPQQVLVQHLMSVRSGCPFTHN